MIGNIITNPGNPVVDVSVQMLAQALQELFGVSNGAQVGVPFPTGFTSTGTLPLVQLVDPASLNSPSGSPANLKSFIVPGGVLGAATFRGFRFEASGSFANNVNAKTITVAFGGSAAQTCVAATASTANAWRVVGSVYVRSATSVILNATGTQGSGTPSSGAVDLAITALTLTNALTLQFACTQTAAADVIQDALAIDLIP